VLNVHDDDAQHTKQHTMQHVPTQANTLRASAFVQGSLALYCRQWLVCFNEYCMRQWATGVNQTPFSPVPNMADDTLNGLDVSRVQVPSL